MWAVLHEMWVELHEMWAELLAVGIGATSAGGVLAWRQDGGQRVARSAGAPACRRLLVETQRSQAVAHLTRLAARGHHLHHRHDARVAVGRASRVGRRPTPRRWSGVSRRVYVL